MFTSLRDEVIRRVALQCAEYTIGLWTDPRDYHYAVGMRRLEWRERVACTGVGEPDTDDLETLDAALRGETGQRASARDVEDYREYYLECLYGLVVQRFGQAKVGT